MEQERRLINFRQGAQVYFLYNEKRSDDTQPIGFFGRATSINNSPIDLSFNVLGYELLSPCYNVNFDWELICANKEMPKVVIPYRTRIPEVEEVDNRREIHLEKTFEGFTRLLSRRGFLPHPQLYEQMQRAMDKLRTKRA
jgi:hypothetical protein